MGISKRKEDEIREQISLWINKVRSGLQVKFVSTMPGQEGNVYKMKKASNQPGNERIFIMLDDSNDVIHSFKMLENPPLYFFDQLICMEDNRQLDCELKFECEKSLVSSLFSAALAIPVKWEEQRVYFTIAASKIPMINFFTAGKIERKLKLDIDFTEYNFYH